MPRLSRKLRVCKWIGTVGCALSAAGFLLTGWSHLRLRWLTSGEDTEICLSHGTLRFFHEESDPAVFPSEGLSFQAQSSPGFWVETSPPVSWLDEGQLIVDVCLWLPFLALLLPASLLWWLDTRPRPGFCRRCDYDLTGNTTGRCPECGTPCDAAPEGTVPPTA